MNPQVENIKETKGLLTFTLKNVNVSIINALRRTILADVPTIVIRTMPYDKCDAKFHKNTSRLNNEILKQRLSCIPIYIRDKLSPEELKEYIIEIIKKNDGGNIEMVTTEDFKIKHQGKYLDDEAVRQIFPPDPFTKDYILFARLRPKISEDMPGEELNITATLSLATAKENSTFNVAATCSYAMMPDAAKQYDAWTIEEKKLDEQGLNATDIGYQHKNWLLQEGKRIFVKDSFQFILESVGVFANKNIIQRAIIVLNAKFDTIKEKMETQTINIFRSPTTLEDSFDIILENEGYTIGKVLEFILYKQFYLGDKSLSFIGFIKKHPHDDNGLLRMAFRTPTDLTEVGRYLIFALAKAKEIFIAIAQQF